jgi:hypothetical protein
MRILLISLVVLAIILGQVASLRPYDVEDLTMDNEVEVEPTNFIMIDVNKDGEADLKLADSTGEGIYDTIQHLNPRPTFQKARNKLIDVDQDGVADYRLVDSNHDGLYDQVNLLQQTPDPATTTPTTDPATGSTTTSTGATVVPLNPTDPIPAGGIVLKAPIIFPLPSATPRSDRVTFGVPPANLTKPVIIDGVVPSPPPKRPRCGCWNNTKPIQYRNDIQYRKARKLRKLQPCPCTPGNVTTPAPVLPPIVAQLKREVPAPVNTTNCTTTPKPKGKRKLAPEYKVPRARKALQPNNCTAPVKKATIKPEFKRRPKNITACANPKV